MVRHGGQDGLVVAPDLRHIGREAPGAEEGAGACQVGDRLHEVGVTDAVERIDAEAEADEQLAMSAPVSSSIGTSWQTVPVVGLRMVTDATGAGGWKSAAS